LSTISLLTEGVKDALNVGTFSQAFTAIRTYYPHFKLAEYKTLRVTVLPVNMLIEEVSRAAVIDKVTINVAVQKQVDPDDNAAMDPLVEVVEEISNYFRVNPDQTPSGFRYNGVEVGPIAAPEMLERNRVFTSIINFSFWKQR